MRTGTNLPEPKNSYFSYTFHQSQVENKTKSVRATIYDVFRSFGSLLAFTIRFTILGISPMQSFSLANSLIKKLYSSSVDDGSAPGQPAQSQTQTFEDGDEQKTSD